MLPRVELGYVTVAEAAEYVGANSKESLKFAVKYGYVFGPTEERGSRKFYVKRDLPKLKRQWKRYDEWRSSLKPKEALMSLLNVSRGAMQYHLRIGTIPEPKTLVGNMVYYSPAEIKELMRVWTEYRLERGHRPGPLPWSEKRKNGAELALEECKALGITLSL